MRLLVNKFRFLAALFSVLILTASVFTQNDDKPQKSQEIRDVEDVPVLLMHLPAWESKRDTARFFSNTGSFREFFGSRKIIDAVDFIPGTEAVFAKYPEGELLIVEYATPQASAAIDEAVVAISGSTEGAYIYRRIGNYNVFLFDPSDAVAGNRLIDQIKYEKVVTWPYGNPKPFFDRERRFILEASSLFISTVLFVLTGLGGAILIGAAIGLVYFQANTRRRASMATFSDAGGLTRLNLDGFTPDLSSKKLLDD